MGILLTVAVTHPENVPTIDLQYEVIDHYFASDRMSGQWKLIKCLHINHKTFCHSLWISCTEKNIMDIIYIEDILHM